MIDRFSSACEKFGLAVSIKKTEVMCQNVSIPPVIKINSKPLLVTEHFTYLGSTISDNLSLDPEMNRRIGKAAGTLAKLDSRVWSNKQLTLKTKIKVYQACVLSTLLYGSESWTTYAKQEKRLEVFHLRCLRRILGVSWKDHITNNAILDKAEILSVHTLLRQRRLRWLGHVRCMQDGRIPKDALYGELCLGARPVGRPSLRYKDVCKRDMKFAHINPDYWEGRAADRDAWRLLVKECTSLAEKDRRDREDKKRQDRKRRPELSASDYLCRACNRDCHARIGLIAHERRCLKHPK